MIARRHNHRPASTSRKSTPKLLKRLAFLTTALAVFVVLPPTSASAASSWWQVTTTSRPTNLGAPKSEVQEIQKAGAPNPTFVSVEGETVACIGSPFCAFAGFPNDETAAQLQTSLEAPYGAGNVEVTEAPAASGRFLITAVGGGVGRYVAPISVEGAGSSAKVLTEGGSGRLAFTAINLGDAPVDATSTPVTLTDTLPAGVSAYGVEAFSGNGKAVHPEPVPVACAVETTGSVVCTFAGTLAPYEAINVEIYASVTGSAGGPGEISVSGANAAPLSVRQSVTLSEAPTPFGVENLSVRPEAEGGAPATQAGSHPFQLTTALQFNQGPFVGNGDTLIAEQPALPRNLRFKLPAGLVGDPTAVPQCSDDDFYNVQTTEANTCPDDTVIGVASVSIIEPQNFRLAQLAVPVFNLTPARGEPARFGFEVTEVPVVLDAAVRGSEAYGVTVSVKDTSQAAQLLASTVTLWGTPDDPRHDQSRGWGCVYVSHPGGCSASHEAARAKPFLRLPTSCGSPLGFGLELEPWNAPLGSDVSTGAFTGTALDGCNREPFDPSIDVEPDTHAPEAPSGLTVHLRVPQDPGEAPEGISESDVRNTKVTLPPGLKINPAAANGLQACSEAQIGFQRVDPSTGEAVFDEAVTSCPEASKLGSVKITTPLLEEPVVGSVYQAAQSANPFNSLLALYVVAEAPNSGIRVKLAGRVDPTASGQLVADFDATPQLPFEEFELSFFGGAGAPLATSTCGAYRTETQIDPWSGNAAATPSSEFQVSGCPSPQPFAPSFSAGTVSPLAGTYSPFVLNLSREDGSQQLSSIDAALPKGLIGKLAGIPYCPEAAIAQAAARSKPGEGSLEQSSPSCPAASEVGSVRVGAGVGPTPYFVSGKAYLAGPYKGAPLSLVIVTPAVAGPFDLGSVVVRTALYVNSETTQITAQSDPFPTILQGIPLDIRSIALKMDRPSFTLNPTSCERMSVTGNATSVLGTAAPLTNPFQVGGCGGLRFAPKLALKVFGKTNRNAKPRFRAVLTAKPGEANIARAQVNLPHSLFLEQGHIKTICTRVQFNAGAGHGEQCPKGSIYGHARAFTPLLDKPLEGPVYLRSSSHKLPDLVAALNGQIDVTLAGKVDSGPNAGIRNTFELVPDAPVSKFILELKGGKKGLLVNSENLCSKTGKSRRAIVRFTGQNGKVEAFKPKVANQCGKAHGHKKKDSGSTRN
ncbi:MAG: hypothetical protein H0X42_06450 [Solirubrobacterales bacterium]|nr:hypothetical protein [Solirubrobacterales bacterium]